MAQKETLQALVDKHDPLCLLDVIAKKLGPAKLMLEMSNVAALLAQRAESNEEKRSFKLWNKVAHELNGVYKECL